MIDFKTLYHNINYAQCSRVARENRLPRNTLAIKFADTNNLLILNQPRTRKCSILQFIFKTDLRMRLGFLIVII